jgi:hypothetical protein
MTTRRISHRSHRAFGWLLLAFVAWAPSPSGAEELAFHSFGGSCLFASTPLDGAMTLRARGACGVPTAARAVLIRFQATPTNGTGELFAFAAGSPIPPGPVLTYAASAIAPATGLSIVALNPVPCPDGSSCGDLRVRTFGAPIQFTALLEGYFAPHDHYGQTWTGGAPLALSLAGPDATVRLRNLNDPLAAFVTDRWSTVQFGLENLAPDLQGVIPPGVARSFFGTSSDGRVGSLRNAVGAPTFGNLLDRGDGTATVRKDVGAANIPTVVFALAGQTAINTFAGSVPVATVAVQARTSGYVLLEATVSTQDISPGLGLWRADTGAFIVSTGKWCDNGAAARPCAASIRWIVPVTPGTHRFEARVSRRHNWFDGYDMRHASLVATFFDRAVGTARP